jgi:hypothetical protein
MSFNPMTPSRLALEISLTKKLSSLSSTISKVHDVPALSTPDLRALSKSVATYLSYFISHNKRRSRTPLDPSNLSFQLLRTYDSTEYTFDDQGNKIKGEKNWYYLVLAESDSAGGDVQFLVEGVIRQDKGAVLEGLVEEVEEGVLLWEEEERERADRENEEKQRAGMGKETVVRKGIRKGKGKVVRKRNSTLDSGEERERRSCEARRRRVTGGRRKSPSRWMWMSQNRRDGDALDKPCEAHS